MGFDFLGFTIRQFPAGKTHTGKGTKGKALGFQTLITPSKEAIKRHTLTIKERLRTLRSASQEQLIKELNPIIWGWVAYNCFPSGERTFRPRKRRLEALPGRRRLSSRRASFLLIASPEKLTVKEQQQVAQLCQASNELRPSYLFSREFMTLLNERQVGL